MNKSPDATCNKVAALQNKPWVAYLWGDLANTRYLWVAALILLLGSLGSADLWTQEHRWADIVTGMLWRHDFLHPYLGSVPYYDKPLLSYWLIIACAKLTGLMNAWILRLPSASAGIVALWAIYGLGCKLHSKQLGLLSAWLLLTTFYFVFWARISSADMLNCSGTVLAVYHYAIWRNDPSARHYVLFGLILALTALCKGLIGPVVVILAITPDLLKQGKVLLHLRYSVLLGLAVSLACYSVPFILSNMFPDSNYHQTGWDLVFRENIVRYFNAFDHKGPWYTYGIFLPAYVLPWSLLLFMALYSLPGRWPSLTWHSRWLTWMVVLIFGFLCLSSSRRSYYVLPLVPFTILFISDWLLPLLMQRQRLNIMLGRVVLISYTLLVVWFLGVQAQYYACNGLPRFVHIVNSKASAIMPWRAWHFLFLDPPTKTLFYFNMPPNTPVITVNGEREQQTPAGLLQANPALRQIKQHTIIISRARYAKQLMEIWPHAQIVQLPRNQVLILLQQAEDQPLALIINAHPAAV